MQTLELKDGGIILLQEGFIPPDLADYYFIELRDIVRKDNRLVVAHEPFPHPILQFLDRHRVAVRFVVDQLAIHLSEHGSIIEASKAVIRGNVSRSPDTWYVPKAQK